MVKKRKPVKTRPVKQKDICFVIMPFGGWLDDYYTNIYCPAIKSAGLDAKRADDLYRPSTIVQDIWNYTKKAKLILADLTGKNPNVFYELGLAHAVTKPAILVTETMDDVPFDLRALRVIDYNKNAPDWGDILKRKIENSIKETLSSPLTSVLPAFLDIKQTTTKVSESNKEIIGLRQEVEFLKREVMSSRRDLGERGIQAREATIMIAEFLKKGVPIDLIIERVSSLGVPPDWVEKQIMEMRQQPKRRRKK